MNDAALPRRFTIRGFAPRLALVTIALVVAAAAAAPVLAPYDPAAQPDVVNGKNLAPSHEHPFGTDSFSRDVLSRVMYGGQTSLAIAGLAVLVALVIGTGIGATAGYVGGATDRWLMRAVDALLAVPRLLLLLVIAAAFGQLSLLGLVLILGLTGWPGMCRIVRAQVRETAALDHVAAARALGAPPVRILTRHVLPAVAPQALVAATLAVATVIPLEAGLSFLGLGVPLPAPSWGNIILEGYAAQMQQWWLIVFPAAAIVLTVLSVNVLGEHLRERLDPRLRPPV